MVVSALPDAEKHIAKSIGIDWIRIPVVDVTVGANIAPLSMFFQDIPEPASMSPVFGQSVNFLFIHVQCTRNVFLTRIYIERYDCLVDEDL